MENAVDVFGREEFQGLTVLRIDDELWFVAKEAAALLGYGNGNLKSKSLANAISKFVTAENKRRLSYSEATEAFKSSGVTGDSKINHNGIVVINEGGVYDLILGSKTKGAERFKNWVTNQVLPSVRKTGGYGINNELIALAKNLLETCEQAQASIQESEHLLAKYDN